MSEAGPSPGTSAGDASAGVIAAGRRRRRVPVIWVIPIVAVGIGLWLAWDTYTRQGPIVRISFQNGEGLTAGQSMLKFKELTFGTVQDMALNADRTRVIVTIATTREAAELLTQDTGFWVVRPRLFAGTLSGLGTLISGSYIEMQPGRAGAPAQRDFVGREDPPVLVSQTPGSEFLLRAGRLGSLSLGSPVFFRDIEVGQVLGWDLADMAESATVHVFVRQPFDRYVRTSSRFWNASGVSLTLGGNGVQLQLESLRALVLGGVAFDTSSENAAMAAAGSAFPLYASHDASEAASFSRKIPLIAYFPGSVRGLSVGADVTLHGLKIGQVTSVGLSFDRARDMIVAPVRFEVEPERFIGIGQRVFKEPAQGIAEAVAHGLRVSLQSANLLTGQQLVALEFDPAAPPATVTMQDGAFVLPTSDGGSFAGLQAGAATLLTKLGSIPFSQIGASLAAILQGVQGVTSGPELKQSLAALAGAMNAAQSTLRKIDSGVGPAMARLPEVSAGLQEAMTNANRLLLSLDDGYGDNTKFNRDLGRLLVELNDAVRSIRSLADLLQRHPEALVRGRTNTGPE